MKIAFYVYPTAFQNPGGGEVQLLKTKEYLEKLGVSVKLFDIWHDKLSDFDILHVFGSVKDALSMMEEAKRVGVKTVLSTICWYSWKSAWGTQAEPKGRILALARHFTKEFLPVIPSRRKRMMQIADVLMPNSEMEAQQLCRYFRVSSEKIRVVPNGVDPVFVDATPDAFIAKYGLKKFALCVGRIEPRKNQLNMIRALSGTQVPFVLIGDPVKSYPEYYQACQNAAGPNIHFLGNIPHDSELLRSAYAACDTFLLASWLETPGLAALEAGLAGARIVITEDGATKAYFRDLASYVNPANVAEIRAKTLAACERPKDPRLKEFIEQNYMWNRAAEKVLVEYQRILQH
jgi:glycosyltransferase involved in cell wall biosynthesis